MQTTLCSGSFFLFGLSEVVPQLSWDPKLRNGQLSSAEEMHLPHNIFTYTTMPMLCFQTVLKNRVKSLPKKNKIKNCKILTAKRTLHTEGNWVVLTWFVLDKSVTTVPHLIIFLSVLTNSCLVNSQGNLGQSELAGVWFPSYAVDKLHPWPLMGPPMFSVNSPEAAADRSEDASVAFPEHPGMKQQVTDVTTLSLTKDSAACSFSAGGQAFHAALLTWAALASHALLCEHEYKGFLLFSALDTVVDRLPAPLSCRPALFLQSPLTARECCPGAACSLPAYISICTMAFWYSCTCRHCSSVVVMNNLT